MRKALDQTKPHRVHGGKEDDRDCRGCRLGGERHGRRPNRSDHPDGAARQLGRQSRQAIEIVLAPPVDDREIVAFHVAVILEAPAKSLQTVAQKLIGGVRRPAVQESDHWHRGLLCTRPERPRRRAAEAYKERAPPHSITSSARASSVVGISRPMALAVLRLNTSSYRVGAWTGRSAGFSPLRMRST